MRTIPAPSKAFPSCFLLLLAALSVPAGSAWAQAGVAKLTDPNTVFHRLYMLGPGNNKSDELNTTDDWIEIKKDLEQNSNHASGSTSETLIRPTPEELKKELDRLKEKAQPGQEVTFFFVGHGGGGKDYGLVSSSPTTDERYDEHIWINDANGNKTADGGEYVTDDELAQMLKGFREGVTLVVMMDACFAGGFTGGGSDIQESQSVAVIGSSTSCPVDKAHGMSLTIGETEILSGNNFFGNFATALLSGFGATVTTLTESFADGAGEKKADANGDGVVTATELKDWLKGKGWELGPPDDDCSSESCKPKSGDSRCMGVGAPCDQPEFVIDPNGRTEGGFPVQGTGFSAESDVQLELVSGDGTKISMGTSHTDASGVFRGFLPSGGIYPGTLSLGARDAAGFSDQTFITIGNVGGDQSSIPGDGDGDGDVDMDDYTIWRNNFGTTGSDAGNRVGDYNGDGAVDAADYIVWRSNFGAGAETSPAGAPTVTAPIDYSTFNFNPLIGLGTVPGVQKGGLRLDVDVAAASARSGRGADEPGGLEDEPFVYVESLGGATGEVYRVTVVNPTPEPLSIHGWAAVEPVQVSSRDRERIAERVREADGAHRTVTARGYCLEYLKQAPPAGLVFRFADQAAQRAFAPAARIFDAAQKLQDAGLFRPDADPAAYLDSIRQWALWTVEQGFDRAGFVDAFTREVKKNYEAAGQPFTGPIADAVRRLAEGRWEDIAQTLQAAGQSAR